MPTNTTYNPPNINSFANSVLKTINPGVSTTAIAGSITNLDYTLTDDCLLTGAWIITNGGNYGDSIVAEVIDTNGIISPAGTVVQKFINNWYILPTTSSQIDSAYPVKIPAGITIRIVYTSTGSNNVFLAVNYKLHEILV